MHRKFNVYIIFNFGYIKYNILLLLFFVYDFSYYIDTNK